MANRFIIEIRTKGFKGAERDLDRTGKAMDGYKKKAKGMRGVTAGLRREIGRMRNDLLLIGFTIGTVVFTIKKFVDAAAGFESVKARLVGLTGSVQGAEKAFNTFNQVAATTPFSLQDVVEAGAQLKAFGVDAEAMIKPVTDLAAFMGTTATEAANSLGRAFAGGAGAADILRERGILNLIKTTQGLDDLSKTTLPEFRAALINTLQDPTTGIAGSTDRMSKTFAGATSNMMDNIIRLSAAIGEHMLPALKQTARGFGIIADFFEGKLKKGTKEQITAFDKYRQALVTNELQLEMWRFKLDEANKTVMQSGGNLTLMSIEQAKASRMVEEFERRIQALTDTFIEQEMPMSKITEEFTIMAGEVALVERKFYDLADPFRQTVNMADLVGQSIQNAFEPGQTGGEALKAFMISFVNLLQQAVLASKALSEALTFTFAGPAGVVKAIAAFVALEGIKGFIRAQTFTNTVAAETGFDGVVNQPTLFLTGEGNKAERVSVTPLQGPNINGPQDGGGIHLHFGAVTNEDYVKDFIVPEIQKAQRLNLA